MPTFPSVDDRRDGSLGAALLFERGSASRGGRATQEPQVARRIARDLKVLAVACGSLVLVAVLTQLISPSSETAVSSADHHHHHHPELAEASTYKLVPTPLLSLNPDRKWHNAELAASYDRPTIGSDLVYLSPPASSEGDEGGFESGGRFLGLTDATPLKSKCPGDHHLTFLPFPEFSPGMVRLRLEPGRDGKGAMEMDSAIPLRGRSRFLTSTPPRSTGGSPEFLNSTFWGPEDENDAECRHRVSADPGGADTEGLAGPLPDGSFIVAEEYGPSLMRVAANGTVLVRFSPRPLNLPKAYYPVRPVLPSILVERRHNKGFESAFLLKPEQSQLACGILQSPLGPQKHSTVVRVVCVDLDRMEMAAVWLLRLDDRHRMVNSADALGEKSFAFLERDHGEGTVYGVDVTGATNVLGHPLLETLEFESPDFDFAGAGISLLEKEKILEYPNNFLEDRGIVLSDKMEGIAKVDQRTLALSNDNDYGKEGDSFVYVVQFKDPVLDWI